jgi:RHS repeat-associated protein
LTISEATTYFTWDVNWSIPQVVDDETYQYVYGLGRIAQVGSGATFYYLTDGLGSTMALTDEAGDVDTTWDYDVFGAVRGLTGSQPNDFSFAGEQVDGSTGLQYLRARYYDPEVGRFISADPLHSMPGWQANRYNYAAGNPIFYTDPLGLYAVAPGVVLIGPAGWVVIGVAGGAILCSANEGCRELVGGFVDEVAGIIGNLFCKKKNGASDDSLLRGYRSLAGRLAQHCAYTYKPKNVRDEMRAFRKGMFDIYDKLGPNARRKADQIRNDFGSKIDCRPDEEPAFAPAVPNDESSTSQRNGFYHQGSDGSDDSGKE